MWQSAVIWWKHAILPVAIFLLILYDKRSSKGAEIKGVNGEQDWKACQTDTHGDTSPNMSAQNASRKGKKTKFFNKNRKNT